MPVTHTNESIQLQIVHSVYKERIEFETLPEGELYPVKKQKLVKQMCVRKWIKKEAIVSVDEYITSKNTIAKNRSIVFDKYSAQFYVTYHSVDELLNVLESRPVKNQIGFTHDTKIHTPRPQVHKYKARRRA